MKGTEMTFETLRAHGFSGILDALIADQSPASQVVEHTRVQLSRGTLRGSIPLVDQYVAGAPMDPAAVTAALGCDAAALRLLAETCEAVAALIDGNPGTLGHVPTGRLTQDVYKRSF